MRLNNSGRQVRWVLAGKMWLDCRALRRLFSLWSSFVFGANLQVGGDCLRLSPGMGVQRLLLIQIIEAN